MKQFEGVAGWVKAWLTAPENERPYFISYDDCYEGRLPMSGHDLVHTFYDDVEGIGLVGAEVIAGLMLPIGFGSATLRRAPSLTRALKTTYSGTHHPRIRVSGLRPGRFSARFPMLQEPVEAVGLPGSPVVTYETYKSQFELETDGWYQRWFCVDWGVPVATRS